VPEMCQQKMELIQENRIWRRGYGIRDMGQDRNGMRLKGMRLKGMLWVLGERGTRHQNKPIESSSLEPYSFVSILVSKNGETPWVMK